MITLQNTMLAITATVHALMAGLFFSYSCSVVIGLGKLNDREYISSMQSINKAIQNPVFFLVFFGALVLLPVTAYMHYGKPVATGFRLLMAATVIYIIGVFAVTALGNIPLNNSLEKFDLLQASKEMIAAQRAAFENRWNNLNLVRTLSSTVTVVLIIIACLNANKSSTS